MSTMPDEDSTPPHHPTYNVRLSSGRINHIISAIYPHHTANVAEAPRGTSYNNRIYTVHIAPDSSLSTSRPGKPLKAVLKLSGHFFNSTKIQNEIACLLLLTRYCPSVPAPTVLAWSDDGRTISTFDKTISDDSYLNNDKPQGWILMTHLPGRPLTTSDLEGPSGCTVLHQIARFNASWRLIIPSVPMFGNIRHDAPEETREATPHQPTIPLNQTYTVGGFLLCHRYNFILIRSTLDYYTYMLKDQIHRVMTSTCYDDVRCDLVPLIAEFVERDLPHLFCGRVQQHGEVSKAVLSHMDLAPRNILVSEDETSGGLLKVTGMVDFEFAAFLPEMDEFVNSVIRQDDDWETRHYNVLIDEMGRLGCRVPPLDGVDAQDTFGKQEWQEVCLLWKLIDNIAPWHVMDGKTGNGEVLDRAGKVIRECIAQLRMLRVPEANEREKRPGNGTR